MKSFKDQVVEFHAAFGIPVSSKPAIIDKNRLLLRAKLIFEETKETIAAMGCMIEEIEKDGVCSYEITDNLPCGSQIKVDFKEIVDGLLDLHYVTTGASIELGIDENKGFEEVHRSNMSKMWSIDEWDSALSSTILDNDLLYVPEFDNGIGSKCFIVKRSDGKIIKSPRYSPADIESLLKGD